MWTLQGKMSGIRLLFMSSSGWLFTHNWVWLFFCILFFLQSWLQILSPTSRVIYSLEKETKHIVTKHIINKVKFSQISTEKTIISSWISLATIIVTLWQSDYRCMWLWSCTNNTFKNYSSIKMITANINDFKSPLHPDIIHYLDSFSAKHPTQKTF